MACIFSFPTASSPAGSSISRLGGAGAWNGAPCSHAVRFLGEEGCGGGEANMFSAVVGVGKGEEIEKGRCSAKKVLTAMSVFRH